MVIPRDIVESQTPQVVRFYDRWAAYMYANVDFNMPDSPIHAKPHCERVLLHALRIADRMMPGDDEAFEILAHASVFHDTRRFDEFLDTGHGARAAVNYEAFCREHPEVEFRPEAVFLMRYHDLDDSKGVKAIRQWFGEGSPRVELLYAIFKDSDALDRWRLGDCGLDPRYLRTEAARKDVEFARRLVGLTMDAGFLQEIDRLVKESMGRNHGADK